MKDGQKNKLIIDMFNTIKHLKRNGGDHVFYPRLGERFLGVSSGRV